MFKRLCLALGLSVFCASSMARDNALPLPLASDMPVEVQLTQQELAIDVSSTAMEMGMQFGLVGALIGTAVQNAKNKTAEATVLPLRNMMVGYDFETPLMRSLQRRLPGSGIADRPVITVVHAPWEARQDLDGMPKHVLVIRPRYAMGDAMGTAYVLLNVTIEDRQIKNGTVKTRFLFSRPYAVRSSFQLPAPGESRPWLDLGAARMGGLIDQSIDQAIAMMVYDFSAEGRQQWDQKIKGKSDIAGRSVSGRIERREGDVVWVRAGNTRFQAITGYQWLRSDYQPATLPVAVPNQAVAVEAAASQAVAPTPSGADTSIVQVAAASHSEPVPSVGASAAVDTPAHPVQAPAETSVSTEPGKRKTFWETYRPKDQPIPQGQAAHP
ncbi:hypothetical protein [Xanthomonas rydalmerensis]|uniref:Conjugal transfer protein n=1 Tax=Xanthomonas rydalmerensis TaxID=3046274 RepID=A0ABZ0JIZ7_9XANT|nr:hypothetical protein [Xanthomonas sp. DM-2023]WOS39724.1 hypothetical protein QN243_15025 [Xanthomonas sp. DM-2023]WOS43908.1 hypothetical protein QN242_15025 [Xanthomonas sp. DM-2023]WOS48088.1 hypothetical protein QN240_15025 [Xanthomonas sp. DM-2023]WOS52267.1 hypothetical protein QN244_15025 [Xanthomonas sp. DM-2023]WOS56451.1 hypothetical protein QN245_15025 [Xanthomonas sp. DM-2023]